MANKKVNTNYLLRVRRSYKALSLDHCNMYPRGRELINHFSLHCSMTLGLRHGLLKLATLDWVPPKSIKVWGVISKPKYYGISLVLHWFRWYGEKEMQIFKDKCRSLGTIWNPIHLYSSFWSSTTTTFEGTRYVDWKG